MEKVVEVEPEREGGVEGSRELGERPAPLGASSQWALAGVGMEDTPRKRSPKHQGQCHRGDGEAGAQLFPASL